jgi:ABC-2 type transport system permease protein
MNAFAALFRREMGGFFHTPVAYAVGFFFLATAGVGFWGIAGQLSQAAAEQPLSVLAFSSTAYWLAMLIVVPLLTMGLFAEENKRGTLESLMTAPVGETAVVLSKFAASCCAFAAAWLPTLAYGPLLAWSGGNVMPSDFGPVWGGYLGTALIGAFFLAAGLLCSLLTRHQAVAAMGCLAAIGLLLFSTAQPSILPAGAARDLARWISPTNHMADFAAGVFDSRAVVWYASATALLLFLSTRLLEARRLR